MSAVRVFGAVVLLMATVAGSWLWLRDDGSAERKAQSEFCWSLVPGGKPEDGASTAECGDALETAMTGRPPGAKAPERTPEYGDERVRVMEKTVRGYADQVMPAQIRRNMANSLTHYTAGVHAVLTERKDEIGADVTREDLILFLREVFGDEKAFQTVYEAQADRVTEELRKVGRKDFTRFPAGATDRAEGAVMDSATVVGTLAQIRTAVIAGSGDEETAATKEKLADHYRKYGLPRLQRMIQDRILEAGVPGDEITRTGSRSGLLLSEAGQVYTTAANTTKGALLQ